MDGSWEKNYTVLCAFFSVCFSMFFIDAIDV